MRFQEKSRPGRRQVYRTPLTAVLVLVVLYIYVYEYRDFQRSRQWRFLFGMDKNLPSSEEGYEALGIPINGQCHAMARFGPPKADGGWNTCMQPALLKKTCKEENEWDCPWLAIKESKWPPKDCVVYSFGSAWNFLFEQAISRLGCEVHTFDPSIPKFVSEGWAEKLKVSGLEFHSIGLGGQDQESNHLGWRMLTLESTMKMLKHERLEVLKVDIEYGEWPFLEQLFVKSDLLHRDTIRQILLEIHIDSEADVAAVRRSLQMFEKFGFVLWARDDNENCNHVKFAGHIVRQCIEISYVRTEIKF